MIIIHLVKLMIMKREEACWTLRGILIVSQADSRCQHYFTWQILISEAFIETLNKNVL